MKQIKFMPERLEVEQFIQPPLPASKFIPKWYSKMNLFVDDNSDYALLENNITPNTTLKACTPFLDALTIGYTWSLPCDLEIKKNKEKEMYFFRWRVEMDQISQHDKEQHPNLPRAFNGENFVSKFTFNFVIETPSGYSTFFTHPINRHDLPFRTFSGVVDTDKYKMCIQFPFQLLETKKDIFILEKGTPVCQFFPFKRENWISKKIKFNEQKMKKNVFNFHTKIKRSYKNQFWTLKEFK